MTLVLELSPEIEDRIQAAAHVSGQDLNTFAANALMEASDRVSPAHESRPSLAEFEAAMDELSAGTENLPYLPLEALTRAAIYEDHD